MIRALTAILLTLSLTLGLAAGARAQNAGYWVQVEAQPTLGQAQERVRGYAAQFTDVGGFFLGTGWYAIALGPYREEDALALLNRLRAQRAIPGDSFIATGSQFRQQFWPVGVAVPGTPQDLPAQGVLAQPLAQPLETTVLPPATLLPVAPPDPVPDPLPDPVQETAPETARAAPQSLADARASEAALSQGAREEVQRALAWAGFYTAGIDGAFGPGTRGAMERWQAANGYAVTGLLTTGQRGALMVAFGAILEGLDMQVVRDTRAGIAIAVPTGAVTFDTYDPPFARFAPKNDDFAARVLLISQAGDRNRLLGLYTLMQTLEIVPPEGPRSRSDTRFEIEGIGRDIHSYTFAELKDGAIKGFTLVWPTGDDARRARVLSEMRASFARIDGLIDPGMATRGEDQAIDLVAGLALRKPRLARSGFYVDTRGTVLTTTEAVADCDYLTLDDDYPATVIHRDAARGLAVLRPDAALAPLGAATFQTGVPRLQSDVAVGGYPYGGVLSMPSLTFGRLADLRGLNGEDGIRRLALQAQPGDAGGPVFDEGGAVLGLLLPRTPQNGQSLPAEVSFSVDTAAIIEVLDTAGVTPQTTEETDLLAPETLTRKAIDMTVLVSCWG